MLCLQWCILNINKYRWWTIFNDFCQSTRWSTILSSEWVRTIGKLESVGFTLAKPSKDMDCLVWFSKKEMKIENQSIKGKLSVVSSRIESNISSYSPIIEYWNSTKLDLSDIGARNIPMMKRHLVNRRRKTSRTNFDVWIWKIWRVPFLSLA
jgi:hypothetical protein